MKRKAPPPMFAVGDRVCRRNANMIGEVLGVSEPSMFIKSDGRSWHHVRVRWINGYESRHAEGQLRPAAEVS